MCVSLRKLNKFCLREVFESCPDSKVHGAHLGPVGPRWAPCWPHELYYQGRVPSAFSATITWALSQYKNSLSRYGDFAYKDNTAMRLCYIYNGNPHTGILYTEMAHWSELYQSLSKMTWNKLNLILSHQWHSICPQLASWYCGSQNQLFSS